MRKKTPLYGILFIFIFISGFYLWQKFQRSNFNSLDSEKSNIVFTEGQSKKIVVAIDGIKKRAFVYSNVKKILSTDLSSLPEADWKKFPESGIYEVQEKEEKYIGKHGFTPYLVRLTSGEVFFGEHFVEIYSKISKGTRVIILNPFREIEGTPKNQSGYVFKDPSSEINGAKAEAYIIGDLETGAIVSSKNEERIFPIASVSKLMTAIIAEESLDMESKIKISRNAMNEGYGNYGRLKVGEEYTGKSLLYPLLLSSSNEAAIAFAENLGKEKFVALMNDRAEKLEMRNTFFAEPSGLSPKNVSTVSDLFKLSREIYKNHQEILSLTKEKKGEKWNNINTFAGSSQFLGGKIGYTEQALKTSVGVFSLPLTDYNSRPLSIIILHSTDWKKDTEKIIAWATEALQYKENNAHSAITEEEFRLETLSLDSVTIKITGGVRLEKDTRDYVAYQESGDFSSLFKKYPLKKDDTFVVGVLKSTIHPLLAINLAAAGYSALVLQKGSEDSERRLSLEKIVSIKTEPVILKKSEDDIPLGILKIDYNDRAEKIEEKIKKSLTQTKSLIILVDPGKAKKEESEILAKKIIDMGAPVVAVYDSPVDGKNNDLQRETLRYKDGLVISGLGEFIGKAGEKGTVFEIRLSGIGRVISIKETPIKIDNQFRPTSEKIR